jgi:hypothetical protein
MSDVATRCRYTVYILRVYSIKIHSDEDFTYRALVLSSGHGNLSFLVVIYCKQSTVRTTRRPIVTKSFRVIQLLLISVNI